MTVSPPPSPWDAHAAVYQQVWERTTSLWATDALVLGRLPAPKTSRLLDVACGAGALALSAASMGFDVTATDLSSAMVEGLKAKIEKVNDPLTISPRVVDGQTLEGLPDAFFDVVASNFGIFLFPDRDAAWRSALRVLKPGGRLLATSWDASSNNVLLARYLLENAKDEHEKSSDEMMLAPKTNRTVLASTFRDELEENGFTDVRVYTLGHPMCFTSGEEFVRGVVDNSAFLAMVGHKDLVSLRRCILEFAQLVLNGVDPFSDEAKTETSGDGTAENHPLWSEPFALPAVGNVAIATKP